MPGPDGPLLLVADLHRHFRAGRGRVVRAVDGVSFTLTRGEVLGLVGESGCGKSTLARIVVGLHRPTSGEVLVAGRTVQGHWGAGLSRQVQILFQDPYASLDPRMLVGATVTEGLRLTRSDRARRAAELLESVGLPGSAAARFPHAFSGGERQRIGLARALSMDPQLLVADEPISALDVSVQAEIVGLLQRLRRERGLACLFIAHDLMMVRHISDRVGVMYLGRFAELGPAAQVFDRPLHPYTRALVAAAPLPDPARARVRPPMALWGEPGVAPEQGCLFAPRCLYARSRCLNDRPTLREMTPDHFVACHRAEELAEVPDHG